MKKTIIIVIIAGIIFAGSMVFLAIVLSNTNSFVKKDGVAVVETSNITSSCRLSAVVAVQQRYSDGLDELVDVYPIDTKWDKDESVKADDTYTEDGYPTYTYSWKGKQSGDAVPFKCKIRTSKEKATILYITKSGNKIIEEEKADLYDENGKKL